MIYDINHIFSLGGEMVDTQDSKSCAEKRGGSIPLQGILLYKFINLLKKHLFYSSR